MNSRKSSKDRLAALNAVKSVDEDTIVPTDAALEVKESIRVIDEFFNQVEEIHENIEKIQQNVKEVKRKQSYILSAPQSNKKPKKELEHLMADIAKNSIKIREKLNKIKLEEQGEKSNALMRIRSVQHSKLLKIFVEIMEAYNCTQTDYAERYKIRKKRQVDLEIDPVENQSNSINFVPQFILKNAQETLSAVEARHAEIKKLEKSIRELHFLFLEMMVLVESQGETIDRIEDHVKKGVECLATLWK